MKTTTFLLSTAVAAAMIGSIGLGHADEVENARAAEAAKAWLKLVDAKEYAKSWTEAAPFFKGKVAMVDWSKMAASVRDPLGGVKSREVAGTTFSKSLPGAPEGEYVVVQFKTSFEHKAVAVETVTPMKVDGVWRVSGYFIK